MDARLVAWARAVKARQRGDRRLPTLWLFTDARLPDPLAAAARLPRGIAGVVLRDDARADRALLGRALARICRLRRLSLSVAGDWRLAVTLRAGLHLRGGRRPAGAPRHVPSLTSSAHNVADVVRARRAAALAFLSPVFPTASHADAASLGVVRWGLAARGSRAAALGGIDGDTARRLPKQCRAAGAIGALS